MKKKFIFFLFLAINCTFVTYSQQKRISPAKTIYPFKFDKTIPLREMKKITAGSVKIESEEREIPNKDGVKKPKVQKQTQNMLNSQDLSIQSQMGNLNSISSPIKNWDGITNLYGVYPPDTEGDVSPDYYIQMVNLSFQIWDKSGNSLYGPVANSTLWNGFGDPWDGSNDGDPVVLYDKAADRWMFSQFALPNYPDGPFYILIAITETGDPLGSWYRYGFKFDDLPDYPKFGIWPDGYYLTVNKFASHSLSWAGVSVAVFNRNEMLTGNPAARMVIWNFSSNDDPWSMLPSNFDGPPPPDGTPNYMIYMNDNTWGYPSDQLRIFECHVDWNSTPSSTLTGPTILTTSSFNSTFTRNISQPVTHQRLDPLSSRLLYRLQYRNFGSYQTLVTNQTVNVGSNVGGVRWYELHNTGSGWSIYQQGTYQPGSDSRWMGSIAMDGYGNIGLGYSVSSSSVYPSIRYVGRYKNDPLGQMTVTEQTITSGSGYQSGSAGRWGDYSTMSIDPIDDATFWYTTEYVQTSGTVNWKTRIASFTLGFDLSVKVFLEGPYSGIFSGEGIMHTDLNSSGYLPELQPFGLSSLSYSGVEKVNSNFFILHSDIVDWVLVELRTGTSSSTIVAQRAGFLKSNGMIVGLDGISPLRFGLPPGNYYIVVRHRNHLAVMSSAAVTLSSYPATNFYDFTTSQTQAYGTNPMTDLGNGNYGMMAGDGNGNGQIQNNDSENIWKLYNGTSGYENADYNMNGQVQNNDNENYWKPNNGKGSQVP